MIKFIFFTLSILMSCSSFAADVVDENSDKFRNYSIEYFYDASKKMQIEDVAGKSFFKKIPSQFALGYKDGNAWFKINISNKSNSDELVLTLSEVFWTTFDAYEKDNGAWLVQKNGLKTPIDERSIKNPYPSFLIKIKPLASKVIYIKGNSVSSHIGNISLFTKDEYYKNKNITINEVYNIYVVLLMIILILISYMYFKVRERVYIFYLAYIMSFAFWISVQSGLYLSFGITGWKDALHVIGASLVFFLIMFSKHLLKLEKHSPVIKMMFDFSAWIVAISGLAIVFQVPYANLFFNIYSSIFFMGLLIVAIRAWLMNYFIQAKYYLIALAFYMPTMGLMTLTYNGFLSNQDYTRYSFIIGSFIEVLVFSYILILKYNERNRYLHKDNG